MLYSSLLSPLPPFRMLRRFAEGKASKHLIRSPVEVLAPAVGPGLRTVGAQFLRLLVHDPGRVHRSAGRPRPATPCQQRSVARGVGGIGEPA